MVTRIASPAPAGQYRAQKGAPNAANASTNAGYAFFNDGDTGLFCEGSDLVLRVDGVDVARITSAGAVLSLNPTVPTPALFDNDTSAINSAFLQRALGNLSDEVGQSSSATLTTADLGKLMLGVSASNFTTTLPLATNCRTGTQIHFFAKTGVIWTIQRQGSDIIDNNGSITSIALRAGDTATFESNNVGTWRLVGGSAALRQSTDFAASTGAINGWFRLPSGLIIQKGSIGVPPGATGSGTVTLPVGYTTRHDVVLLTPNELNNNATFGSVGAMGLIGTAYPIGLGSFAYDVRTADNSAITTGGTVRVNWISMGL